MSYARKIESDLKADGYHVVMGFKEAAKAMHCSPSTVQRLVRSGSLRVIRRGGKMPMFRRADVARALAGRR